MVNNLKAKPNWTQWIRRAVQLISFIVVPGLFITVFSAVGELYVSIINGTFNLQAQLPQLFILLGIILTTVLLGRFFCGFICAFGALGDSVWAISRRIRKKPLRISEKTDRYLKLLKYGLLSYIVIAVWTFGVGALPGEWDPWTIFGLYAVPAGWTSFSGLLTVGFALLVLILIGSFFIERFFCRYFCPLGAIFTGLSKLRILKIKKLPEKCGACRLCSVKCAMGIPLYKYEKVTSGECIDCFECVDVCPRSNMTVEFAGSNVAPLVAGVTAAAAIMGTYYAGRIAALNGIQQPLQTAINEAIRGNYTDGVYTGSGEGYRGVTSVSVTVENGYITEIAITDTSDDSEFFSKASNTIISDIITKQASDVDTVSGATYSSKGIIQAVANALGLENDKSDESTPQAVAEASPGEQGILNADPSAVAAEGNYQDGTYTGSGTGYSGTTTVEVIVEGGEITSIDVVSHVDEDRYFSRALSVITKIISGQSTDVDTVSGATFSCNGIIEAVADALNIDFTNPNDTAVRGGHGNGRG
jgi:uncharacterized protein with FMN-binding domain